VGWEQKEPVRATGVPTPPTRRHRNFLVSLLLVYSYMRDQRQFLFSRFSTTIKIPVFAASQDINIIKKHLQNLWYQIFCIYLSGG